MENVQFFGNGFICKNWIGGNSSIGRFLPSTITCCFTTSLVGTSSEHWGDEATLHRGSMEMDGIWTNTLPFFNGNQVVTLFFLMFWFTTGELSPLPFPSISPVATTVWQIREIKDACPDLFESKGSSGLWQGWRKNSGTTWVVPQSDLEFGIACY